MHRVHNATHSCVKNLFDISNLFNSPRKQFSRMALYATRSMVFWLIIVTLCAAGNWDGSVNQHPTFVSYYYRLPNVGDLATEVDPTIANDKSATRLPSRQELHRNQLQRRLPTRGRIAVPNPVLRSSFTMTSTSQNLKNLQTTTP